MQILVILFSVYAILIFWLISGWKKNQIYHLNKDICTNISTSIVVACKNESKTLPHLLLALKNQTTKNFELILIDDHSTDNTWELMNNIDDFHNVQILKSAGKGKKQALKTGIEHSSNNLIITTDADCIPTSTWIQTIINFYEKYSPDLILGPVEIKSNDSFFENIQQLEFQTLIASGAGAAGNNQAIMCNGANLAFKRNEWLNHFDDLKPQIQSGDDIFFLHALKRKGRKIRFLKSAQAMVFTNACTSIRQLYFQRKRWASKAPSYTDATTIIVALIVLCVNMIQVFIAITTMFNTNLTIYLVITSFIKMLIDWYFIQQTNDIFVNRKTVQSVLALTVLYPFYIFISAFAGITQGLIDKRKDNFR